MNGTLLRRDDLSRAREDAMFALFRKHFDGVSRARFRSDLVEKGWVVLLENGGELAGFSTIDFYDVLHQGAPVSVVYSGDTIVEETARASAALSSAWIGSVNRLRRELGKDRLWWLLIVSGYRTYRFLPIYWRRFVPCCEGPAAPGAGALRDFLAADRFGDRFDAATGIVRLDPPQVLREELRGIPARRLRDPHVAFFAERNPGHERGDELVCLTELSPDNLTAAGRRMWELGERAFADGAAP